MNENFDSDLEQVFQNVSDLEVDRNPALCRQTEKIRRLLAEIFHPSSRGCFLGSVDKESTFSRAGEYALLK